jgi:hypothetical protein
LALEWAIEHVDHQPCTWAQRLGFVRVFARHWSATDPRTEIPQGELARQARLDKLPQKPISSSAIAYREPTSAKTRFR